MNFSDIIGQSTLVKRLQAILASGRIVHSYIFIGPEDSGRRTLADIFARGLVCEGPGPRPCDGCRSCRQFQSGNHPDVKRIWAEDGKKAIGVDIIRALQADIKVKPFQGERKIYIISDVMTEQAQNALLKTLEEPPGYAVLVLFAENSSAILPTVLSRCQIQRVARLSTEAICHIIQNRTGLPREKAAVFAALSGGLPGKGLKMAASDEYRRLREEILFFAEEIRNNSKLDMLLYSRSLFTKYKDEIDTVLDIIVTWYRDILVYCETGDPGLIINLDKISSVKSQAQIFTIDYIKCIIEVVEQCRKMLKANVNYQLTIDNMLLKIQGGG